VKNLNNCLYACSLLVLAACGGSKEPEATAKASESPAAKVETTPASPSTAVEVPAAQPESPAAKPAAPLAQPQPEPAVATGAASSEAKVLKEGPRTPAEIATPFTIPESERRNAAPYPEGQTIDTPLVVRGETIPTDEVRRVLCMGLGYALAEYQKVQVILEQELDLRQSQGEDISKYEVSEADLQKYIESQRVDFVARYPTLDFKTEVGRAFLHYELYLEPARQSLLFDRLFLPEDPHTWPELTKELIRGWGGADGELFLKDAYDSYERRKKKMIDEGLDSIPPDDPVIVGAWRQSVLDALTKFAEVKGDLAVMKPGVLMTVDDKEISIDSVWKPIAPYVTEFELSKARRMLATLLLLEQDLSAQGKLLSQEEFEKVWTPEGRTYREAMELHQSMAIGSLGMPSMGCYARYTRLLESLRRAYPEEAAKVPEDREFVSGVNQVTGAAKCDSEAILCSAWDGDTVRWKENGWQTARARAFELMEELQGGANWKSVRELNSEFWDPPMPEIGQKPQFGFRFKGAFGPQTRNQLVGLMEESEAYNLLYGGTVADRMFFRQKVGTIEGPFMGPRGYYICRVNGRTPPNAPLDMGNPAHRELVTVYFLRNKLNLRAHELMAAAATEGAISGI
jgi:hypothetical protein